MHELPEVFERLAIALGLGLLVGLQRERAQSPLAGIRTFALLTLLGAVCALLAERYDGWIVGLGALGVAAMLMVGNLAKFRTEEPEPGLTTEIAALLMFGVGAYVMVGHQAAAVALGGVVALLLHFKEPMHDFVARLGEEDVRAVMQFVLIALVILPILPDQEYGPYAVLNPHEVWMMVVLIVGISLGGYVAYKLFGQGVGALLGGVLGGAISSTATTVSYSRRSREQPQTALLAASVIMIASVISVVRVLVEIAAVASAEFWRLAPPLLLFLLWMCLLAASCFWLGHGDRAELPTQHNPAELKPALIFGALYAIVILGVAAALDHFGAAGLYAVGVISGLTDMDAITLSTSQLVEQQRLETDLAWRVILTAALANLVFKGSVVALLGDPQLRRRIAVLYGLAILGGVALLLLWPAEVIDKLGQR